MQIARRCKICGKEFTAIKLTQFFCCRKCFKKDYYIRTKSRIRDMEQNPSYPSKQCGFCLKFSKMFFDPIKYPKMYDNWGCPYCGATNKIIWDNQENSNSYQIISKILISIQYTKSQLIQQSAPSYKIYQIPVNRLEQGNPHIIVMPCERMNFFEINRRNRKKITFS